MAAVTPIHDDSIATLIRSVKKEHVRFYLTERFEVPTPDGCTISQLIDVISQHDQRQQIVGELSDIAMFSRDINEDTYREMARDEGVVFTFEDPTVRVVMKMYVRERAVAESIYMYSQATKLEGFTEIPGVPGETINLPEAREAAAELEESLRQLIHEDEPGRRCVVKVRSVEADIVMIAYVEQRQTKVYTLGAGDRVEALVFSPTSRSVAIYDTVANRLRLRTGPSTKLQQRIAQSFGKTYFQNNEFFSLGQRPVYNLEVLSVQPGIITVDQEAYPDLLSVSVIEETLRFTLAEQDVLATFKAADVEALLPHISSPLTVNFAAATRVGATFEFRVSKTMGNKVREQSVKLSITHGNRIEHDPRYRDMIHDFLRRWGMEQ